jgi:tetratricopeptide (TPR) repeat protein
VGRVKLKKSCLYCVLTLLTAGCAGAAGSKGPAEGARDPNASTVIAEIALERGDCRSAAETYAAAAQHGEVSVARRASEVSLACEHLPAAWESVKRWRALAPTDPDAATIYATVALKLYHVPEAKSALATVLKSMAAEGSESKLADLSQLFLQEADASSTFAALSGAIDTGEASAGTLALLAELALEAYDTKHAEELVALALKKDPSSYEARHILTRAYVMKGDGAAAVQLARDISTLDTKRGQFELAETLIALDRLEEARAELERLRSTDADKADIDRRLALLAYEGGDYDEAQKRFAELAASDQATDASLLYLADIAEQDGDSDTALAGYKRLINSSLAVAARTRAAAILLDKKQRGDALAMLDDYISEHPDRSFDLTVTKANLLADHGEIDTGLALLAAALDQHPQHPSLEYDRAVLLEKAGKVKDSVSALQKLLTERQDDPTLLNALGYTLADHNMELARAEGLIRKSLGIMPDNPAILDSMGWVRFRRGDSKGAIEYLKRSYQLAHDPEIAAHWAEALWKSGAQQEARAVLATALARHPDSDTLKKTIARFAPKEKA